MDLYQPQEMPWRLVVGDGDGWDICDTFMNSAKEVSFCPHALKGNDMIGDDECDG